MFVQFANDAEFPELENFLGGFSRLSESIWRKGGASCEMLTECELRKWSVPTNDRENKTFRTR